MNDSTALNKKLVIAFDAKRLFCNHTGLGNFARTLVRDLQSSFPEHEYHLFSPKTPRNPETELFFDPLKFTIHRPNLNTPLWRLLGMSGPVNTLKPDIFHGLSHEIPFGIHPSIKTVVSFHDLIYEHFPHQFGKINYHMYRWKYRSSVRRADHVVAISRSTRDDLVKMYHIPKEKIDVIYQSCHPAFQVSEPSPIPDKLPFRDYFLYVGSVIERKGLLQTVIAFGHLPVEFRRIFVVVGKGDKVYRSKVYDMIKYYGLETYFHFLESVTNPSLVALYDHAYALIYPSIYEGFGIPVIEALFRGTPVITSNLSSMPEAAGPGGILVDPFLYDEIAQAMILIQSPGQRNTFSRVGYQYVTNNFVGDMIAEQWMKLYLMLTDNGEEINEI